MFIHFIDCLFNWIYLALTLFRLVREGGGEEAESARKDIEGL